MSKENFGKTGSDIISGFNGIITAHCEYITGCLQYLLEPKTDPNGVRIDSQWFDESRIQISDNEKVIINNQSLNIGFGKEAPKP